MVLLEVLKYGIFLRQKIANVLSLIWSIIKIFFLYFMLKGTLSGLTQFLAAESPLKMMKKGFYFTLISLFVLKIFKFFSRLFCHVENRVD